MQLQVQTDLQTLGFYSGALDGAFGGISWAAIQTYLQSKGYYVGGAVDGDPGPLTCAAIQQLGRDHGGYTGDMDNALGALSWGAFIAVLNADVAAQSTPAPTLTPVPVPAPAVPTPVVPDVPATPTVADAPPVPAVADPQPVTPDTPTAAATPAVPAESIPQVAPIAETTTPAPQPKEPIVTAHLTPEQLDQLSQFNSSTADGASRFTLFSRDFWTYSLERVIKSVSYTASAQLVGAGGALFVTPQVANALAAVGWGYLATTSLLAGLTSLLVSLSSFKNIK